MVNGPFTGSKERRSFKPKVASSILAGRIGDGAINLAVEGRSPHPGDQREVVRGGGFAQLAIPAGKGEIFAFSEGERAG